MDIGDMAVGVLSVLATCVVALPAPHGALQLALHFSPQFFMSSRHVLNRDTQIGGQAQLLAWMTTSRHLYPENRNLGVAC
jgi:hypothetical protein